MTLPSASLVSTVSAVAALRVTSTVATLLQKRLPPTVLSHTPISCSGAFDVSSLASEDSAAASAAAGVAPVPEV